MSNTLISEGHKSIVISNGGIFEKDIIDNGAKHISLPIHKKSIFSLFLTKCGVYEDEKLDIIVSQDSSMDSFFACRNY